MKLPGWLRSLSTLQLALGVSVLLHVVLLSVRFIDPQGFNRVFEDTPLEVILVNARSNERPDEDKAQAIAQFALAGGGEAAQGRATSPLPYSALNAIGNDFEEAQRKMDAMQEPLPDPIAARPNAEQSAQDDRRRQLVKLLAEIEKRINEESARPKKRYISPTTRDAVYAVYYDTLRRKVEAKGTRNFPEQNGAKLYGDLTMVMTVNHDGRVLATEIVQGSGSRVLDTRAEAIAQASGPFGEFGPEMRKKADQIAVVSRFKFRRDQTLETSVQ